MVDLHTADLSATAYADAFAWIEASAVETQRVDFKETLSGKLESIVETCCAFANAYGGVVVVGFVDPDRTNGQLTPTPRTLDLGDKALLRLDSTIVDLVRPGIRFEIARFPTSLNMAERPQFAVIRIPASPVKPHEVLPNHIFPVRRDRRNDRLGSAEIEAMVVSRAGGTTSRDRWSPVAPYSSVQFGQPMIDVAGPHIGVSLSPVDAHLADFEHGRDDDVFVEQLMRRVSVVGELAFRPEENGVFMAEGSTDRRGTAAVFKVV
ncbi:MAG: ATP-binding protein [Candidatus Eremiobacteraeota bacterium]|nr:ATP-binding protein [Candidatus Eremiobacteraeota bacterium]MBC5802298.1 ATP-binding protein [Candidatus Eremiobacteraeota bacterium]MBC5824937.1 ATP-binding protein [Candidatus Eremiobacteraeota bacterium]